MFRLKCIQGKYTKEARRCEVSYRVTRYTPLDKINCETVFTQSMDSTRTQTVWFGLGVFVGKQLFIPEKNSSGEIVTRGKGRFGPRSSWQTDPKNNKMIWKDVCYCYHRWNQTESQSDRYLIMSVPTPNILKGWKQTIMLTKCEHQGAAIRKWLRKIIAKRKLKRSKSSGKASLSARS